MTWKQFWGMCEHKWYQFDELCKMRSSDKLQIGTTYVLRCEKCGDLKKIEVSV